jgi:fatty-acyl-CoA synthase
VLEAAVIAVPDEKWMERPFVYVVPRPGKTVSPDELREFLADKVAKFWIPERYAIIEAIPKTSVGKFLKTALREKYEREDSREKTS